MKSQVKSEWKILCPSVCVCTCEKWICVYSCMHVFVCTFEVCLWKLFVFENVCLCACEKCECVWCKVQM